MLPTKEVLLATPLHLLRNSMTSKVESPEEENLLAEIINQKESELPSKHQAYRGNMPVIVDDKEIGRGELVRVTPEGQVEPVLKVEPIKTEKKFCQFCDSRGARHKLNCTRVK